ncbi:MAG: hypothetical protein WCV99_00270 [Sterolibacterium sp.]|jgi:hypothetical protein
MRIAFPYVGLPDYHDAGSGAELTLDRALVAQYSFEFHFASGCLCSRIHQLHDYCGRLKARAMDTSIAFWRQRVRAIL